MALMPSLRRRGVVKSWREHTPGSIVVTLAPVTTLLSAAKRNREREHDSGEVAIATPESLLALDPETLAQLRRLATLTIESLGVDNAGPFVEDEMQRVFATLTITLPVSTDREGTLQRAIRSAIDEMEG